MSEKITAMIEEIKTLTVLELSELVKAIEEEFGVTSGIYVASVSDNGGAKKAGLKEGDVITKIDGQEVGTMNKINTILVKYNIGDTVEVEYVRDKETKTTKVTLTGM